jgi:hypothetical protein
MKFHGHLVSGELIRMTGVKHYYLINVRSVCVTSSDIVR